MKTIIPETLDAAVDFLLENLKPGDIAYIIHCEESGMSMYHHTLGQWMRNRWGLWNGSKLKDHFENLRIWHGDDMSSIILITLWRVIHNKPILLEKQIQAYHEFWAKPYCQR